MQGSKAISYRELAGKLLSFCRQQLDKHSKIKVVVLFSDFDQGKGSAVLKLFKQFSSFPLDIAFSESARDIFDSADVTDFPGISIVICALPTANQDAKEVPVDYLSKTVELNDYLSDTTKVFSGKVILLSGISVHDEINDKKNLPASKLIPWYMLVRDSDHIENDYRQPELNQLLDHLEVSAPLVRDLDELLNKDA